MEILQGVSATIRFPAAGDDAASFTSTPTVTITRDSDGSTVVSGAETTKVEDEKAQPSVYYTYSLAAAKLEEVDRLKAVWSDGTNSYTTEIEVVGGFIVSLNSIEEKLGEEAAAWKIEAKREIASREIESACGVAFRPRYAKEVMNGSGSSRLLLPSRDLLRVISAEVDDQALSEAELADLGIDPLGIVTREGVWPAGRGNVVISYAYGHQQFAPAQEPVRDYAAYLLAERPMDWNERATGITTEMGSYALVTPGVRGARFPLPAVNAFVDQYAAPLVG